MDTPTWLPCERDHRDLRCFLAFLLFFFCTPQHMQTVPHRSFMKLDRILCSLASCTTHAIVTAPFGASLAFVRAHLKYGLHKGPAVLQTIFWWDGCGFLNIFWYFHW